jgi:hypothetical protein
MTGGKEGEEGMRMKKVIGVAAVIMVIMAIVLIAFSSTVSAKAVKRNFTEVGGVIKYSGSLPSPDDADHETIKISAYEGEEIEFVNNETGKSVDVTVSGPYQSDGDSVSGCADYSVTANKYWNSDGMKTGYFFKVYETNNQSIGCWFSVDKQSFSVELVDDIDKVQETENFTLTLKKNNKKGGVMKLTIEDNEGYSIQNATGTDIYERRVNYTEKKFISFLDPRVNTR